MKVVPKIMSKHKTVNYSDLKDGNAFIYCEDIYIKTSYGNQVGVCVSDCGHHIEEMCDEQVIPIDAIFTWKYKDTKKSPKSRMAKRKK